MPPRRPRSNILNRVISNINREIGTGSPLYKAGGARMLLRATGGDPDGAAFLAALAIKESSAGKHAFVPNNFWGWGIHAGPSVNRAPSVAAMAARVWKGLKTGPYYNTKGKRTSNQIMNVYAPPSENNTALYERQNNERMARMVPGYNPNTNLFAPGIGGGTNAMVGPAGPGRVAQSVGTGGGPGGVGGAAAGLAGSLQLNPQTAKLIRQYIRREDRALSQGRINTNMKLWNRVIGNLQQLPRTGVGQTVMGQSLAPVAASAARTKGQGAAASVMQFAGGPSAPEAARAINAARQHLGLPYSWGGGGPKGPSKGIGRGANTYGFDCSGLTEFAWAKAGVAIGSWTGTQIKAGRGINTRNRGAWKPGDLIFPHSGHVQLYIGNGKVIEAPRTGGHVQIVPVRSGTPVAVRRPKG